jgi:hypothetical protein
MILNREPALIYGLVNSFIALVCAFGLELSTVQTGSILALTSAVLAVVVRQQVFSPATVEAKYTPKTDVEGEIEVE